MVSDLFAVLGARGASVLITSGDFGVSAETAGRLRKRLVLRRLPCVLYVWGLISPCELYTGTDAGRSLDRRTLASPLVLVSIDGMENPVENKPEVASNLLGGGFSAHIRRLYYNHLAVATFLQYLGIDYSGLYKCIRSRDLTQPPFHYVICASLRAAVSPISPCG